MECAAPTLCAIQRISIFGYLPTPGEPNCGVCEHHCLNHPDTRWSQVENDDQNERPVTAGDASPGQASAAARYLMGYFRGFGAGTRQPPELRPHAWTEWRCGQSRANSSPSKLSITAKKTGKTSILARYIHATTHVWPWILSHFGAFVRDQGRPRNRELSGINLAVRSSVHAISPDSARRLQLTSRVPIPRASRRERQSRSRCE